MKIENGNNNTGHYPLYLGEELGLIDNIHETYPDICDLRDELLRNRWDWREIDMSKDAVDLANPELAMGRQAIIRNLAFQYAADSLAATSIIQVMGPFCTNSELMGTLQEWEGNEYVHAMSYSQITKKGFADPNELMEEIKNTEPLLARLRPIQDIFDHAQELSCEYALQNIAEERAKRSGTNPLRVSRYSTSEYRKAIIMYHAALLALEGVAFSVSFSATFGTAKAFKAYEGIKNSVQLIARDELDTHVSLGIAILPKLRADWPEEYAECLPDIQALYDAVYTLEVEWMDYLFDGITIVGFNATLLDQYVRFLMAPICDILGIEFNYERVDSNPIPWMTDYLDLGDIQVAAQETQLVNYNVNVINDDVSDDDELDFDF